MSPFNNQRQPKLKCRRWESTDIQVAYDTPLEVIEMLHSRLKAYVSQNNREWSNVLVNIDKMEYQNALTLIIAMERKWYLSFLLI